MFLKENGYDEYTWCLFQSSIHHAHAPNHTNNQICYIVPYSFNTFPLSIPSGRLASSEQYSHPMNNQQAILRDGD